MKKIITLVVFVLTMCGFTFAQSPLAELDKVKALKLLESTRDDAVKLLSPDSPTFYESADFHNLRFFTNNAVIEVSYSSGKCSDEWQDWNVPEFKITKIAVTPKDEIEIKDIGIDYSKFRREEIWGSIENDYVYHDKTAGIAITTLVDRVEKVIFTPSKKDYSLLCNKKEVRKYYSSKKWNRCPDYKNAIIDPNSTAYVTNLVLSQTEITVDDAKEISVSTTHVDPEGDVVTFNYFVSGGKIIGQGARVIWDLSGVKAGTYTITAAVDDGCGFCGKFISKTVVVKE